MATQPVIRSLADNDLYKFTMQQVVFHRFPDAQVEYAFQCRDGDVDLRPVADAVRGQVAELGGLRFAEEEIRFLGDLPYFSDDFTDFLAGFRLDPDHLRVDDEGEQLAIRVEGPWLETIPFEVPLLAIVNQCYMAQTYPEADLEEGRRRLEAKIRRIREHPLGDDFRFVDFGTRRRFSRDWHREVVERFSEALPEQFVGTSDVRFAMDAGVRPVGTMAHEFMQAMQAFVPLEDAQRLALETWAEEYRGHLAIALTDNYGLPGFIKDFDAHFAERFPGLRQDSGDPFHWGETMIRHLESLGRDPRDHQFVFSDSLSVDRAFEILEHFHGRVGVSFGIGTHLTNDLGHPAVNIVIKMVRCDGVPVAKLSDDPGKALCEDPEHLRRVREVYRHPQG